MRNRSYAIPDSLHDRLRDAVWHTRTAEDGYANHSELVRAAIESEVSRLEAAYNGGRPFPAATGRVSRGPSPQGAARGAVIRQRLRAAKQAAQAQGDGQESHEE
ncbi:ParB family protein [Streptomyces harbinensis]|uniref:ParB family protein n=1 Tax=Streptomyces harbinensis TaxID=1176198 RepID=UPI000B86F83B